MPSLCTQWPARARPAALRCSRSAMPEPGAVPRPRKMAAGRGRAGRAPAPPGGRAALFRGALPGPPRPLPSARRRGRERRSPRAFREGPLPWPSVPASRTTTSWAASPSSPTPTAWWLSAAPRTSTGEGAVRVRPDSARLGGTPLRLTPNGSFSLQRVRGGAVRDHPGGARLHRWLPHHRQDVCG